MKSVYFFLPFVSASFSLNAANTSIPMLDKSYRNLLNNKKTPSLLAEQIKEKSFN
ncbi:hypothetical protein SAMN05421675_2166 [Pasteurella multocida]|nr:hypothetical protein SAMN05421675_2166 [Pasteurella multocida]VEE37075.1 Uncharacterised protein [Pasteurella multocida subsp. gallicida]